MKKKINPLITTIDNEDMVKVMKKIYYESEKIDKKRSKKLNKILDDMKDNFSSQK